MSERLTTEGMIAVIDRELFRLRAALTEKHAMSLAHVHLLHRRMMAVAGLRALYERDLFPDEGVG